MKLDLRRIGVDQALVVALVVALFFQRLDYSLWMYHGFPIPDVTYVFVGALLIVRAAFLIRRGAFDLGRLRAAEAALIVLFVVFGLSAIGAALIGRTHPQPKTHYATSALVAPRGQAYTLFKQHANASVTSPASRGLTTIRLSAASTAHRALIVFIRKKKVPFTVQPKHRYRYSLRVRSTRAPVRVTAGITQIPARKRVATVSHVREVRAVRSHWTTIAITMDASPKRDILDAFVELTDKGRPSPITISDVRVLDTRPVVRLVLRPHLGQSVKTFVHYAFLALIALLLGRLLTPALMRRALGAFFVLAVAVSIVAILQAIDQNVLHTGASHALHLVSRRTSGFVRPCSVFSEPALLGYFALLGVVVGLWLHLNTGVRKRWLWAGLGLCLLAMLLAAAAGPIVTLVPVVLYVVWRAARVERRIWSVLAALAVVALAVVLFLPAGATLSKRASSILSGSDASAKFRYAVDSGSLKLWELSPFTGVGLGNSRFYLPHVVHLWFLPHLVEQFQSVNAYLAALSEGGVFSLLALAVMLLALLVPRRVREGRSWLTESAILLFVVAFFFINGFSYALFWFWAGLRLADLRQAAREPAEATERGPVGAGVAT